MATVTHDDDLRHLVDSLGLTPEVVERRRALLGYDDAAAARLRALAPAAVAGGGAFIDHLYRRMLACPATAGWLRSDTQIERLKQQQRAHHARLFTGDLDWPLVLECLRIGMVHHRVRLTPQWYVATFAHWVADHVDLAFAAAATTADAIEDVAALLGRVLLEVILVLDAYGVRQAEAVTEHVDHGGRAGDAPENGGGPGPERPRAPAAVSRLRVATDAVGERAAYVELDDDVRTALRAAAPALEAALPSLLDEFYTFFTSYPATAALVRPDRVERLKQQVASYWRELARADFDRSYAASRARIGIVHERIGLSIELYLIGLARQTVGLLRRIAGAALAPAALVRALVRALFFDLSFVLDAYLEARVEALLRSEGYAAELLAGITSAVAVVDGPRRWVESANPALLTMFGLDAQLVRNLPIESIMPLPGLDRLLDRVVSEGEPRVVAILRSGSRSFRVTTMRLTSATPLGQRRAAVVLDELTDVGRVTDDAATLEQGLSQLSGAIRAVLWEADVETWTVHLVSQPVLSLTGFRDVYFLGRVGAWLDLMPEPERSELARRGASLAPGERCELVHRLRRADGALVWVRTELVAARGLGGAVVRGVTLDVTSELDEQRRRLAAIGRLAGGVAHEFNNLLMVIDSALTLLGETVPLGREGGALVTAVGGATRRAVELTRNLLAFAERQPLRHERVDLNDVASDVARSLGARLRSTDRLIVELEPGLTPCEVDRPALSAAVVSLVDNALAAMPDGGRVYLSTRSVPASDVPVTAARPAVPHVELTVRDTGAGMTTEVQAQVFEPFFTTRPGAAGLGLPGVRGFVQQSGGHLLLTSEPARGTEVRLRFPAAAVAELSRVRPVSTDRPRVLVVDDEPTLRNVIARLLERDGVSTLVASHAREALELLDVAPVAVLVTDVVLGSGMSGGELGREARRRRPGLPVIYISGYTRSDLHLSSLGEDEWFLPKPISPAQLREVVHAALASHRAALARGS